MGILTKLFGRKKSAAQAHAHIESTVNRMLREAYIAGSRDDHSKATMDQIVERAMADLFKPNDPSSQGQ